MDKKGLLLEIFETRYFGATRCSVLYNSPFVPPPNTFWDPALAASLMASCLSESNSLLPKIISS